MKEVFFSVKMVYNWVRGWTLRLYTIKHALLTFDVFPSEEGPDLPLPASYIPVSGHSLF